MKTFKRLFIELLELEEIANAAMELWEDEPESEELEKLFDDAYTAEWNKHNELANHIVEMTGGKIEYKIASKMPTAQREKMQQMVARIA